MKFGIIGNPVAHSLSPRLFAEAYPGSGHSYDIIEEPDFEKAYAKFLAGYDAVNVTMPFKELAYYKCKPGSDAVRTIKAVNILKKTSAGQVLGFNSDYLGVRNILEAEDAACSPLLVVGCGGAAKAAAVAAVDAGFKVSITNRSYEKCHAFVRHCPLDIELLEIDKVDVGRFSHIIYCVPTAIAQLQDWNFSGKTVLEANYAAPCLKDKTLSEGGRYIDGKVWLKAQADTGFNIMLQ